mmetsp:Transcript_13228/g.29074  ORF Transcript_13228/g.29074 Transcript_13228/m.29074 type:complete len:90 (-) Transcript_13228:1834-2103(-)
MKIRLCFLKQAISEINFCIDCDAVAFYPLSDSKPPHLANYKRHDWFFSRSLTSNLERRELIQEILSSNHRPTDGKSFHKVCSDLKQSSV